MANTSPPDLTTIYADYHARVVAYATRLLGADEAADVAQEVFIKVGRALDTLADPSRLGPWIYAITLNTVRDTARKRALAGRIAGDALPSPAGEQPDAAGTDADPPDVCARTPEEILERNEMVACYLGYVEKLPPTYYEAYVLSEFEDLANEEIARRLSVSLATAKIRLHRARARLHDELRRHCYCYHNERGELMGAPKRP